MDRILEPKTAGAEPGRYGYSSGTGAGRYGHSSGTEPGRYKCEKGFSHH